MPLVSIIIPVYKVENVLHYCVESILSQTFIDYELILVDDGSPDESGKICDEFANEDNRIVVIHTENCGVSSARNSGLDVAKGKYVLFIDSDDYINPNYIESLLELGDLYPECDNIWCGFQTMDSYSFDNRPMKTVLYEDSVSVSKSNVKEIMTLHEKWLDAGPYCKLFERKKIIENNLRFPIDLSLGEDLSFNFSYLDCTNGEIAILNKSLYNYISVNDTSLGSKYYSNLFEIYNCLNQTMKYYIEKWKCDDEQFAKYYDACFFKFEVVLKNTFSKSNNTSLRNRIKFNNKVLSSSEFCTAYNNMMHRPNILYRIAYRLRRYEFVFIAEKIFKLLNK